MVDRSRWSSRTVFLLAAIGSAVGLGNVWRFPYLAGKYGGGAFLIPYIIALFLVGIPLLMLEFAIGQKMQRGAVGAFKKLKSRWGALGVFALLSSFIIVCYYAVVMAWSLLYFLASFGMKWAGYEGGTKAYFFNEVLQVTAGPSVIGGMNWPVVIALIFVWVAVYFSVWKGAHSVGKVVWITVPLPLILLGVLLIRAVTLDGFLDGWAYYLVTEDWSLLWNSEIWIAAFSQIFFTLTLAFGVMIAYASYKKENADIAKDAWTTALVNSAISLFAGFVVFAVLGYMAFKSNVGVASLAASGPGLAFVVFPEALSLMPWAGFFSAIFFLTLLMLGIDSAFSLVEAINAVFVDKRNKKLIPKISFWVCLAGLLGGLIFATKAGIYYLDIVDHFVTNFNLIIIGILQAILAGWIFGAEKVRAYINKVSDVKLGYWWTIMIKFVVPIVLMFLLVNQYLNEINKAYEEYSAGALAIGWFIVAIPFLVFALLWIINPGKSE